VLSSSISYFVIHDTFRKLLEEDDMGMKRKPRSAKRKTTEKEVL
jgi:hypothetical protein